MVNITQIDLIQPRHNYAAAEGLGHVYMPTALLTVAARLIDAGIDVRIHDENINPRNINSRYVGISLLGSPYIPEVIRLQEQILEETGEEITFLLGGQRVVSGLTEQQFRRLFGGSSIDGNKDENLARVLGINPARLKSAEQISLVPAYRTIQDSVMKEYLSREFGMYVSQGCKFDCDFCGAVRTIRDPVTGELKKAIETYRNSDAIRLDLEFLVDKSKSFGLSSLSIYVSNLDVFQTPKSLEEFAGTLTDIKRKNTGFDIKLRGLSTVDSYLATRKHKPRTIEKLVEAGFNTVGFGVDGWGIWKKVHKAINTEEKCLDAIISAREDFGLTPEVLMVFGHAGVDTEESLRGAYEITLYLVDKYGAIPRPHVAKSFIPGNKGWSEPENAESIEKLIQHPESFQALDFTALASKLTHPDDKMRELANEYFLKMCAIHGNTTQYVLPITPEITTEQKEKVKKFNQGRFDR